MGREAKVENNVFTSLLIDLKAKVKFLKLCNPGDSSDAVYKYLIVTHNIGHTADM